MKRVCCNCQNNIRTGEHANIECHCAIDGHYIGYIDCFNHWCKHWEKDKIIKVEDPEIMVEVNGKLVPLEKLPCWTCEWRYSIHCPKCEWNKDGKAKVY